MRIVFIPCILLIALPAWAGTWKDDFEDGNLDGWEGVQIINNGKVEEKDGKLVIADIDRSLVSLAFFNNGQDNIRDFTLSVDVNMTKADTGDAYPWIVFRYTDTVFAFVGWEADNSHNLVSIFQTFPNGNFVFDIGRVNIPLIFEVDRWYQYRLEMKGAQATFWIDDQIMAQADWKNIAILPEEGQVGLGGGGGEFHFDNFVISGDEVPGDLYVKPVGKLSATWGQLRVSREQCSSSDCE